uniref:Peptidase S1 domain-containing protein n=1 Tax=Chelonoidis abingdonii TaxID=106734 RepID=A0A8C0IUZ0_CHEAB
LSALSGARVGLPLTSRCFTKGSLCAPGQSCPVPRSIEHGQVEHLARYQCDPYYQLRSRGDGEIPPLPWGIHMVLLKGICLGPCPPLARAQRPVCPAQGRLALTLLFWPPGLYRCSQQHVWVNEAAGEVLPICEPVCGKPKNPARQVQRIIGGMMAAKNSFPWQGRLLSRHNHTAGATLISDQWLLTTGRNLYLGHSENSTLEEIALTLRLFLGRETPAGAVERIVLHPEFPGAVDLALLKLKHKVPIGEAVMPICLAQQDYAKVGRVGFVSGWGWNVLLEHPKHLKYVLLPVADSGSCQVYYQAHPLQPLLNNHTFCVGMSELRESTCVGDAGSAFAIHDPEDDTWYAAGILSFDRSCQAAKYGIYVRVLSVLDWIKETMAAH